jgi:hypothetical protein
MWRPLTPLTRQEKLAVVLTLLTAIAVALAAGAIMYAHAADLRSKHNEQKAAANAGALGTANATISALGGSAIPTPYTAPPQPTATVTVTGAKGDTGNTGAGPTQAEVQAAVALFCASGACGQPPTAAQVAQAVATYCGGANGCKGSDGTPGAPGASGAPGAAGQNATPDQIAAAVASYCAANSCQGATGPTGPPGPNGLGVGGFTFTVPGLTGSTTYTCSPDTSSSSSHYTCVVS